MKWLKKLLLPFEEPDHPLYYNHAAEMKRQAEEEEAWNELIESDATWQLRFTISSDPETDHYL